MVPSLSSPPENLGPILCLRGGHLGGAVADGDGRPCTPGRPKVSLRDLAVQQRRRRRVTSQPRQGDVLYFGWTDTGGRPG